MTDGPEHVLLTNFTLFATSAEWTKKPRFNVLIVGPSGVGKSCLLEKVSQTQAASYHPRPVGIFAHNPSLLHRSKASTSNDPLYRRTRSPLLSVRMVRITLSPQSWQIHASLTQPYFDTTVLELTLLNMHMHFWDLGGSQSVRTLWSKYYDESDAVVWVVDARHFVALHAQSQKQQHGHVKGKARATAPDAGTEAFDARESSWKLLCKC